MMKHHHLCRCIQLFLGIAFFIVSVEAQEITTIKGNKFRIEKINTTGIELGMEFGIVDGQNNPSGTGRLIKIKGDMGLGEVLTGSVDKGCRVIKFDQKKSEKPTIKASKFYLDTFASGSYSSIQMDDGDSPLLAQFGAGISVGYWIKTWGWVGLTSDYRFINQYSTPTTTTGNFRGTYWNYASLSMGKRFGRIITKLDIHYFGKYTIANKTASGKETSYTGPVGLRIVGLYPLSLFKGKLHAGGLVEWIELKKQTIGTIDYDSTKKLWQAGIVVAYIY